jgi:hypothetical protein
MPSNNYGKSSLTISCKTMAPLPEIGSARNKPRARGDSAKVAAPRRVGNLSLCGACIGSANAPALKAIRVSWTPRAAIFCR